jgi:Holliday junction resolvase
MTNRSKQKGTAAESAVVQYLREQGWHGAERRALSGALDKGDVAGVPLVCIEVKDCKTLTFGPWLEEAKTETRSAKAEIGFVWAKRRGKSSPADWFCVTDGATIVKLLEEAGYGGRDLDAILERSVTPSMYNADEDG